jgi:hypothetical protein
MGDVSDWPVYFVTHVTGLDPRGRWPYQPIQVGERAGGTVDRVPGESRRRELVGAGYVALGSEKKPASSARL